MFQGNGIEIIEMILKNDNNKLVLFWELYFEKTLFRIKFYNVSRFRIGELSMPLEIQGFEIIDHSRNRWEKDSTYEIRDFEDDRVNFFCEFFEIEQRKTGDDFPSGRNTGDGTMC